MPSHFSYEIGKQVALFDDFYGVLMGAMRLADGDNTARLETAFPEVYAELQERYNAPGGYIESDPDYAEYMEWRASVTQTS